MKKYYRYLRILPFIICIVCLVIYLVYVIHLKLHPSIVVTDSVVTTLKVLLIVALVSLFIGLLLVLLRKIYSLKENETVVVKKTTVTKEVIPETIKEEKVVVKTDNVARDVIINKKVKTQTNEIVSKEKKEEKVEVMVEKEEENKLLYVSCPECGGLISSNAAICPHCGILFDKEVIKVLKKYDKQKDDARRSYGIVSTLINIFIIIIFIIFIIIVTNALIDKYDKNNKNLNPFSTEEKQK